VLEVLASKARGARRGPLPALAATGGSILIVLVYLFSPTHDVDATKSPPAPHVEVPPPSGAKGEPIPPAKVVDLLASEDGPRAFESYALVVGVCGYEGEHAQSAPCRDARAAGAAARVQARERAVFHRSPRARRGERRGADRRQPEAGGREVP
jgi:hypothetical protein